MASIAACTSVALALSGPREVTIVQIFEEYEWSTSEALSRTVELAQILQHFDLVIDPPLGRGDINDVRVLSRKPSESVISQIKNAIIEGEGSDIEFKSSLTFDRKRAANDPGKGPEAYRSSKVLHSALKTIAAFANSSGGSLLIGVSDQGEITGIEDDMLALSCPTFDAFELRIRSLIEQHFHDGKTLSSYCSVQRADLDGKIVCRVQVAKRNRLAIMNMESKQELYVRDGNRTVQVGLIEIEAYFDLKKLYVTGTVS